MNVPWLVHHDGERREINAEESALDMSAEDQAVVEERLQDLGYA